MPQQKYGLGRIHMVDERDKNYSMSLVLEAPKPLKPRTWTLGPVLNQGDSPHCVGYASAQWAQASPYRTKLTTTFNGDAIYADCKKIDGYPTQDGTDSRSAMKVLAADGKLKNYYWANSAGDLAQWISTRTGVLLGIPWHQDMFTPDQNYFVHPTGPVEGGHEVFAYSIFPGTDVLSSVVGICNSWGTDWGKVGTFYMTLRDVWGLIEEGGDAVAAVQSHV